MKRLILLLAALIALAACTPGQANLASMFNPEGVGLNEQATVQRGPNAGEVVTVTGYDGHASVDTTLGRMPLAWLGTVHNSTYWCFGQWVYVDTGAGFAWQAPRQDIVLGVLDLRSVAQAGVPGGIPEGSGLFVYSEDPADASLLCKLDAGDAGNTITTNQEKNLIRSKLGLPGGTSIDAVTICGVVLELSTTHADVVGLPALQADADGQYRIHFGPTLTCVGAPPFV